MIEDPHWPRASAWLADSTARLRAEHPPSRPDLVVLGVPAHRTSLSPTGAHETPGAIRAALARCSTWVTEPGLDLAHGAFADGLVTLDAHHDLRDGTSNGSPVRRLVEAGLDARRVVQVGIADFANSPQYAARARELGITVVPRGVLDRRPIADVMAEALEIASGGSPEARVHVDLDVDVCDRSVAPACPAALPGGISARQLREVARIAGADPRVVAIDVTEVDATADAPDQRTVRLAALCLLEVATGVLQRPPG